MKVLGLIGKQLTGPWMQVFYTSAESEIVHLEGIRVVRDAVASLKKAVLDPCSVLTQDVDFFGRKFGAIAKSLLQLHQEPSNREHFGEMLSACLNAVVSILERQ